MDKILYWKFFCNNTFAKDVDLKFFSDGSFAITTVNRVVSLYSSNTEFVRSYEHAHAFDNGCICEHKNDTIIVYHCGTEHLIPCPNSVPFFTHYNAISIPAMGKVYFLPEQKHEELRVVDLEKGFEVCQTSADGKMVVIDPHRLDSLSLIDTKGKVIPLENWTFRIDLLPCGAYIVYLDRGPMRSRLYNKENELVLSSDKNFGINMCGDVICYEDALLANLDGHFIGEYKKQSAVYEGLSIFPYYVCDNKGNKRLWPGGKMMRFNINPYLDLVLCYWHAGHFYFVPQYYWYTSGPFGISNKPLQRYIQRIQELQF